MPARGRNVPNRYSRAAVGQPTGIGSSKKGQGESRRRHGTPCARTLQPAQPSGRSGRKFPPRVPAPQLRMPWWRAERGRPQLWFGAERHTCLGVSGRSHGCLEEQSLAGGSGQQACGHEEKRQAWGGYARSHQRSSWQQRRSVEGGERRCSRHAGLHGSVTAENKFFEDHNELFCETGRRITPFDVSMPPITTQG